MSQFFFCFNQKTAYEMRISDWSSDVCSSDLGQTLRQALIHAYRTNPSLTAARAGLRATDEGVPIAKAAARPSLSATADYQEFVVRSANSFSAPLRAASANANLSFPLYQGGRVKNAIR